MSSPKNPSARKPGASTRALPRAPVEVAGVQINFCKNPLCENFGSPVPDTAQRGPGAQNPYRLVSATGIPCATCLKCNETFPLKSNLGISEEVYRLLAETFPVPTCPILLCVNHRVPITTLQAYQKFGSTKSGSQRYRCKECGQTFAVKPPGRNPIGRQEQSSKNRTILAMLVGKMPLRRICEAAGVAPKVLYRRIDFFHEQALAFLADRESRLPKMQIPRLYIGVDRQDYVVNWTRREDKRNVVLTAVASADNKTGYVFGMHANFDPEVDPAIIEEEAGATGDVLLPAPHRRFARLWLQADYDASVKRSARFTLDNGLEAEIRATYTAAKLRQDIEASERCTGDERLPDTGMQIHSEYTLYGHFLRLHRLFSGVEKVRFFLDQESGIRAACLGAFVERVKARTCDAFYVRIAKELTVDEKRRRIANARGLFQAAAAAYPGLDENAVKLVLLKLRIAEARALGPWKDRWVFHPLPTMAEPEKAMCWLTDFGDYDEDHLAWLYAKASLHAVDTWFNRVRRRSSLLERPLTSSANWGRKWNGYSAYRPEQVGKMLTIMRACHNYVWTRAGAGSSRSTPAVRLGLAKAPLDYNDIIYYSE